MDTSTLNEEIGQVEVIEAVELGLTDSKELIEPQPADVVTEAIEQAYDRTALHRCAVRTGSTGRRWDGGNAFSRRIAVTVGRGYRCVNVQLTGWDLNFAGGDHHIDRARVKISAVSYDPRSGVVRFTVEGIYRDRNGDDSFYWEAFFSVLSLG